MTETCFICGRRVDEDDRLVLVRGRVFQAHCSRFCVGENLRKRRIAAAVARRRLYVAALLVVVLPSAASVLWQRYRAPQPEAIASGPPDELPPAPRPEPVRFGPAWPPTDADWNAAFSATHWIYPLPGPMRRPCSVDDRLFGGQSPGDSSHPPRCRSDGYCGVDLGGDLWGEHVYAAHDGVVDRVKSSGGEDRGGLYVRLSHFGGMVFTQYFQLAAVPGGLVRGVKVKAGDIIGLLGDTGLKGEPRHLHFTLSIRPSEEFSEVYWDPKPWMLQWPLRLPARGSVAGLVSTGRGAELPRLRRVFSREPPKTSRTLH